MADIKFSQFTLQTDFANVSEVVGYDGATNVRITPSNLISTYLLTSPIEVGSLLEATGGIEIGKNAGTPFISNGGVAGATDLFFGSNAAFGKYFRNLVITTEGYFGVNSALGAGIPDILRLETDSTSANIGELELRKYGVGTFTGGTPVYNLGVDANGVIKETSLVDTNTITGTVTAGEIAYASAANVLSSSNQFTFDLAGGTLELFEDVIFTDNGASSTGSPNTVTSMSIGTGAAATKGAIEVEGFINYDIGANFNYFLEGAANTEWLYFTGVGGFDISYYGEGRFLGSGIHIFSDERIKKDISVSDSKEDLETISKIEISNYKHINQAHGDRVHKKVIAQQVIKHYPEAVSISKDVVPCIYEKSTIEDGIIKINVDSCGSDTCCKLDDKIKLIYPDGSKELVNIIESDGDSIKVDSDKSGEVFVYGKEVDDYHSVDYDALAMLNISATQELYKIIKELKQEIKQLKQNNN